MEVTGVVEDALAAKSKARKYQHMKNEETSRGLRMMEVGRWAFVAGWWGVIGLRRRILVRAKSILGGDSADLVPSSIPSLLQSDF